MKSFADVHVHLKQFAAEPVLTILDTIAACGVTRTALQALCKYGILNHIATLSWG